MNVRKVAVVSILCVVVAIAAFLIYDLFPPPENLKNHVSVSIEKAEYWNFTYGLNLDPYNRGWYVNGCDVNLTVGIHSILQSDANVAFNVTIANTWGYNKCLTETVFVEALQNKNLTLTAWVPNNEYNQYSAEILDVQKSAR